MALPRSRGPLQYQTALSFTAMAKTSAKNWTKIHSKRGHVRFTSWGTYASMERYFVVCCCTMSVLRHVLRMPVVAAHPQLGACCSVTCGRMEEHATRP